MKIAVYGQSADKISKNIFLELLSISKSENIILLIEEKYNSILLKKSKVSHNHKLFSSYEDLDSEVNLMITIGGDGTNLRSISFIRDLKIPIIGINTGRLGFLATLNQDLLKSKLEKIIKGEYKVENRTLLQVTIDDKIEKDDILFKKTIIDKNSLDIINGSIVDFKKELIGNSFVINNPKASSSCGCGLSFSV